MIAVVTVLLAFPLGRLVRDRNLALVLYVALYAWAFSYQGAYLMLMRIDGDYAAFQPDTFPLSYGILTLAILGIGLGLVQLGHRLRERKAERVLVATGP